MHLLRQRSLGDAVLIGHSTLKHDNVRLGLPKGELREERLARGQTPYRLCASSFPMKGGSIRL